MAWGDHIQSTNVDTSASSADLAYVSNNTLTNTLSVVLRTGVAVTNQVRSITDTAGNEWSKRLAVAVAAVGSLEMWTAHNCKSGANTVTITLLTSTTLRIIIQEHEGLSNFDSLNSATGTGTAVDSGAVTTLGASQLVLGGVMCNTGTSFAPGNSFVERQVAPAEPNGKVQSQDKLVTPTTINSLVTMVANTEWAAGVIALKLATIQGTDDYQQEVLADRFTIEDGTGVYLVEPWAASAVSLRAFYTGDLSGIGTSGRFLKDRLN